MKSTIAQIAVLGLFSLTSMYAQEGKEARADKKFDKYAYVDAIKTYERIAEKGYKNSQMLQKLGDSYYFNAKYAEAAKWYGELIAMGGEIPAEYYYRYAQSLKSTGDHAKADQMMELFKSANANDSRASILNKNKDYRAAIEKNSGRYTIEDAGINSSASDYGTAVRNKEVYFTTARDTGNFAKRIHTWDGNYLTNFYTAELNDDGSLNAPRKLKTAVKTRFHESTAAFSPDGNTMYFTRNNFNEGKRGRSEKRATLLKIYAATWKDSTWTDVRELPFNDDNFNTAHPAVSADGQWLYFASDREGGFGGSDLYKVQIGAGDTFGAPINLGSAINTAGRETFPFISKNNELYFSSDGHPGLGGLDIFMSKEENGNFGEAFNVGAPANSPADDFGYYVDSDTKKGFLSSNREGGQGSDDIYKFVELKELETKKESKLIGSVEDLVSTEAVPNAEVILMDEEFNEIKRVKVDENGKFDLGMVEAGKKYYVKVEAEDYQTNEQPIIISKEKDVTELRVQMERKVHELKVGDNLADVFKIKIIYFDFDKSDIRPDAAIDLAKIVDVMQQHPTMQVDVQSHTDSRGTAAYNRKLSDRRAKSTMAWMKQNGIDAKRLTGKGYGESQLVNKCADNVDCSEEEHQANRRSLFIITAL